MNREEHSLFNFLEFEASYVKPAWKMMADASGAHGSSGSPDLLFAQATLFETCSLLILAATNGYFPFDRTVSLVKETRSRFHPPSAQELLTVRRYLFPHDVASALNRLIDIGVTETASEVKADARLLSALQTLLFIQRRTVWHPINHQFVAAVDFLLPTQWRL